MTHYLWSALTTDSRLRVQQEQFAMNPHLTRFSFAYSRTFFFLQGFSTHTYTHPLCLHLLFIARCACGVCYFFLLFFATFFLLFPLGSEKPATVQQEMLPEQHAVRSASQRVVDSARANRELCSWPNRTRQARHSDGLFPPLSLSFPFCAVVRCVAFV